LKFQVSGLEQELESLKVAVGQKDVDLFEMDKYTQEQIVYVNSLEAEKNQLLDDVGQVGETLVLKEQEIGQLYQQVTIKDQEIAQLQQQFSAISQSEFALKTQLDEAIELTHSKDQRITELENK
jgi:chromosome segregation ATPase